MTRLTKHFQPELNAIKKELNLLQRLYKLYNDVIDRSPLQQQYSNKPSQSIIQCERLPRDPLG